MPPMIASDFFNAIDPKQTERLTISQRSNRTNSLIMLSSMAEAPKGQKLIDDTSNLPWNAASQLLSGCFITNEV